MLWAPEIVHECKTTKEIIQSIQRPNLLLSIYSVVELKKKKKRR